MAHSPSEEYLRDQIIANASWLRYGNASEPYRYMIVTAPVSEYTTCAYLVVGGQDEIHAKGEPGYSAYEALKDLLATIEKHVKMKVDVVGIHAGSKLLRWR